MCRNRASVFSAILSKRDSLVNPSFTSELVGGADRRVAKSMGISLEERHFG